MINHSNATFLGSPFGQQKYAYYTKLQNVIRVSSPEKYGYTCGSNEFVMTSDRYVFVVTVCLVLLLAMFSSFVHMAISSRR